tara:strand:+ start:261 stop:425 length:165 start_codon:yes stop_codon:yes gene_type:complete
MSKEKVKIILKKIVTLKSKVNKLSKSNESELYKKKLLKVSLYMKRVVKFLEKIK